MKMTWQSPWQSRQPEPDWEPDGHVLRQALARIARLEAEKAHLAVELLAMSRREAAARRQADALAVRIAAQGGTLEDLVRANKTLLRCEDMLAACRDQHGTNSHTGAPVVLG